MTLPDTHWHARIIAGIALSQNQPRYLEIGIATGETFREVAPYCSQSIGVDVDVNSQKYVLPSSNFFLGSSDDFFRQYRGDKFDLIFIDGEHTYETALKDYINSVNFLNNNGIIVLHDTCPRSKEDENPAVCGDVFKVKAHLRDSGVRHLTLNGFPGLTIVQP